MPAVRRKHVPLRTCIACQQKLPKRELVRVVRRPEGAIEIDRKGKLSGRGAYLCPKHECLESALERRKLASALKCTIDPEQVLTLRADLESLLTESARNVSTDTSVADPRS